MATRPITDRVKQSLFDALSVAVGFHGGRVLDVFAGTGSIGLECLSRGAMEAIFMERDRHALLALRNNIEALGVKAKSQVLATDVFARGDIWGGGMGRFDLIFFDPPYPLFDDDRSAKEIDTVMTNAASNALAQNGVLLLRTPAGLDVQKLRIGALIRRRQEYGSMAINWLASGDLG